MFLQILGSSCEKWFSEFTPGHNYFPQRSEPIIPTRPVYWTKIRSIWTHECKSIVFISFQAIPLIGFCCSCSIQDSNAAASWVCSYWCCWSSSPRVSATTAGCNLHPLLIMQIWTWRSLWLINLQGVVMQFPGSQVKKRSWFYLWIFPSNIVFISLRMMKTTKKTMTSRNCRLKKYRPSRSSVSKSSS